MEGYRRRADWIGIILIGLALIAAPALARNEDPPKNNTSDEQQTESQPTDEQPAPETEDAEVAEAESPLVRAARASRDKAVGSSRVYTNEDALKSKGSLIEVKEQPPIVTPAKPDPEEKRARSEGRALDKVKKDYEDAIAVTEAEIAALVEEQRSLEDGFYEEVDDPADREAAEERFNELQKQVDEKTAKLDDTREKYQQFLAEYRKRTAAW